MILDLYSVQLTCAFSGGADHKAIGGTCGRGDDGLCGEVGCGGAELHLLVGVRWLEWAVEGCVEVWQSLPMTKMMSRV